jgi:uncharacterized protein DUF6152
MIRNLLRVSTVTVGLLLAAIPALAHHSFAAEFDEEKPIEFTGTVKEVEWTNPHVYTQVQVKLPDGSVKVYRVEGSAPNSLVRNGWKKDTLKPGDEVSVKGLQARNAASRNVGRATIMKNGKPVFVANYGNSE